MGHTRAPWVFGLTLVVWLSGAFPQIARSQSIQGLGMLPGKTMSGATGVSADGSVVCGFSHNGSTASGGSAIAFRWTSEGGLQSLGTLGGVDSYPFGISGDGSTIVGRSAPAGTSNQFAFRWTPSTGLQNLGSFSGQPQSHGYGTSHDGQVVVGMAYVSSTQRNAFRWTSSTGLQNLGSLASGQVSYALNVSDDGATTVGFSRTSTNQNFFYGTAFRQTGNGGMQSLGTHGYDGSEAMAVSADGSVLAGSLANYSGFSLSNSSMFRWTVEGGMQDLGALPGANVAEPYDMTPDGSTIVGWSSRAFLWRADLGMVDLNIYLPQVGVSLAGWSLTRAHGISADGLTIVGTGVHNGVGEGWIVHIPAPGSATALMVFIVSARRSRLREREVRM